MRHPFLMHSIMEFFAPRFCNVCQGQLLVTEDTICSHCNTMIATDGVVDDASSQTARLFWGHAPIAKAGVLFDYHAQSPISELLASIKYRQHIHTCHRLGRTLACRYLPRQFFEGIDVIVPIPLHAERFRRRGFNQSEEIARGIGETVGLNVLSDSVLRTVDNPTQTHLTQFERLKNVDHIFSVPKPHLLEGKHILIVDDVITTGATVSSLIRTIFEAAPHTVFSILALGRGGNDHFVQTPAWYRNG